MVNLYHNNQTEVISTDARKIHLIEEILKTDNEETLTEVEYVLACSEKEAGKKKVSAHDFLGLWDKEDAELIEQAIREF